MRLSYSTHELLPACHVLFGAQAVCGVAFLDTLHEDLLKSVFRKRAFETHPDRASSAGLDPVVMTLRFQEVQAARDLLNRYLAERATLPIVETAPRTASSAPPRPRPQARPHAQSHTRTRQESSQPSGGAKRNTRSSHTKTPPKSHTPAATDFYWNGRLPDRPLPIGEYLYYSGFISLQALIAAIHSQRTQRPVFGQLAHQWGYLSPLHLRHLVSSKRVGERVGDAALRLGLLTPFQRDAVLGMQRSKQRPFGRFLIEAGLMSDAELGAAVRAQRVHNFGRTARRAS